MCPCVGRCTHTNIYSGCTHSCKHSCAHSCAHSCTAPAFACHTHNTHPSSVPCKQTLPITCASSKTPSLRSLSRHHVLNFSAQYCPTNNCTNRPSIGRLNGRPVSLPRLRAQRPKTLFYVFSHISCDPSSPGCHRKPTW